MNYWEILGIPRTDDISAIRKAYAAKCKIYHPETHPEEFKQLHTAYKTLVSGMKNRRRGISASESNNTVQETILSLKESEETTETGTMIFSGVQKNVPPKEVSVRTAEDDILAQIEAQVSRKKQGVYDDPMIKRLLGMLEDGKHEYYPQAWRRYFICRDFFVRQYNPEFINAMAEIIEKKLLESAKDRDNVCGRVPTYLLLYNIIVYGCMFENIGLMRVNENVYKKELLTNLKKALRKFDSMLHDYLILERRDELLGERYAFYVYRNILEILECENPDRVKLKQWLIDGFDRTNTSHVLEIMHYSPRKGALINNVCREKNRIICSSVFCELMAFLLSSQSMNAELFEEVLEEVCKIKKQKTYPEEKEILVLMIEENRAKRL